MDNSEHIYNRLNKRLNGLVTNHMVKRALHIASIIGTGKYYIELAKLNDCIHLPEDVNGDVILAIIKDNELCTIMLAKSWKRNYYSDGKYVTL